MKKLILLVSLLCLSFPSAASNGINNYNSSLEDEEYPEPLVAYPCSCEVGYEGYPGVSLVMYVPGAPVIMEKYTSGPDPYLLKCMIKICVTSRLQKVAAGICLPRNVPES